MLLRYLAWCVQAAGSDGGDKWLGEPLHEWAHHPDIEPMRLTHGWRDRLAEEQRAAQSGHLGTHPWGMHLGHGDHIGAPSGRHWAGYSLDPDNAEDLSGSARLIGVDPRVRLATFVSDHIGGWYAALAATGADLPHKPGDRSWRIDVFVKAVGYLGEYRRSRETGLWFSGRHRYHRVGN